MGIIKATNVGRQVVRDLNPFVSASTHQNCDGDSRFQSRLPVLQFALLASQRVGKMANRTVRVPVIVECVAASAQCLFLACHTRHALVRPPTSRARAEAPFDSRPGKSKRVQVALF